jgi:hypothetical protein
MQKRFSPLNALDFKPDRPYISRKRHPFNDKRRHCTWIKLSDRLFQGGSSAINRISRNRAESAQFYRFLSNPQVGLEELIYMNCQVKAEVLEDKHVLVLGDTSSWNLKSHIGRIQDSERLGVLEDNKTPGFMSHVHLAIDAVSEDVLGIADVLLWCRLKSRGKRPSSYMQNWEDKESYKWPLGIDNASAALQKASCRTFVLDRDADNYDLFLKFHTEGKDDFVIRSRWDRQVQCQGQEQIMSSCVEQGPALGTYEISLPALDHYSSTSGKRVKRKARKTTIEVRAALIGILPPSTPLHPGGPVLPLYLVQAREVSLSSDAKEEPILWRLVTSHPVTTFEQAKDIIRYYLLRWIIEQLFRTAKTQGFDLEATQLETFDAIQRQTVMVLHAAAKVLQLVYARDKFNAQPIEEVFNHQERTVLGKINQQYQGTTDKQKNPYPESKTSWATWIVARLGGWKGYQSQRPPGPITIKRGLDKFATFIEAYNFFDSS